MSTQLQLLCLTVTITPPYVTVAVSCIFLMIIEENHLMIFYLRDTHQQLASVVKLVLSVFCCWSIGLKLTAYRPDAQL